MRNSIFALLACCFLLTQCSDDPDFAVIQNDLNFVGSGSGCEDFFVYKLNENKDVGLTVTAVRSALNLGDSFKTYDLLTENHIEIRLDKWANDKNFYCTDIVEPDAEILNSYISESGLVNIQITQDSIDYSNIFQEVLYTVNVQLENVILRDSNGEEILISEEFFSDVLVGWTP